MDRDGLFLPLLLALELFFPKTIPIIFPITAGLVFRLMAGRLLRGVLDRASLIKLWKAKLTPA